MKKADFHIIESLSKARVLKPDLDTYFRALGRNLEKYKKPDMGDISTLTKWNSNEPDLFKQTLFLEVKLITHGRKYIKNQTNTIKDAEDRMNLMFGIMDMFSALTPKELMQMYPVDKHYDGKRWGEKDYYSTMESLEPFDIDVSIGEKVDAFELLCDYQNRDIDLLVVEVMMAISDVKRSRGQLGVMEEFMEEHGVTPVILHEKEGYIFDPTTGTSQPIRKPKKRVPKWMKVIE